MGFDLEIIPPETLAAKAQDAADGEPLVIKPGESTSQQIGAGVYGFPGAMFFPGLPQLPSTFFTYRQIRGNPTVSMARLASNSPVKAAELAFEKTDKGDDGMVKYIKANISPLWRKLLREGCFSRDYGFAAMEKIWTIRDGDYFIDDVKPLLTEATMALHNPDNGMFVGAKNFGTTLPVDKVLWFTYDGECGSRYGRSWYEGDLRSRVIPAWIHTLTKLVNYITKVAGVIPMIEYPDGVAEDENGNKTDTFAMGKKVLGNLATGNGVLMPNTLARWAEQAINRGIDIDKLKAWNISFVEAKGQHGGDFNTVMRLLDSYIVRALLTPERAIMEGQFGTKAEAGVHTGLIFMAAEEFLNETIVTAINTQMVDQLLTAKYGSGAKGAVYLSPPPLVNAKRAYIQQMLSLVLTNPANVKLLLRMVNMDALLDIGGLPKVEEGIDNDELLESLQTDAATGAALMGGGGSGNDPFKPGAGAGGDDGEGEGEGDEGDAETPPDDGGKEEEPPAKTKKSAALNRTLAIYRQLNRQLGHVISGGG